jgi:hypothetical protein
VDQWLTRAADRLAQTAGIERLELSDADAATLLDLARIAAHESGERSNAPLLCYLVGRAQERGHAGLDDLTEALS